MAKKVIPLSRIVIDRGTQSRVAINEDTVKEYAEAMERQVVFPPMLVYYDKSTDEYILADGFHRYHALKKIRPESDVTVDRRFGMAQNALWASIIANQSHGLQRTTADKRNAIRLALIHPKGTAMSDRQIGRHLGVDNKTVASVRKGMELTEEIPQSDVRVGADGRAINTANITHRLSDPIGECGDCDLYNGRLCMKDGETHDPCQLGCADYEEKLEAIPPMPTPPPADQENVRIIDPEDMEPKRVAGPHAYRKLKDRITVYLPPNDKQMFAVELRHQFEAGYLLECIKFLARLLADEEIAD